MTTMFTLRSHLVNITPRPPKLHSQTNVHKTRHSSNTTTLPIQTPAGIDYSPFNHGHASWQKKKNVDASWHTTQTCGALTPSWHGTLSGHFRTKRKVIVFSATSNAPPSRPCSSGPHRRPQATCAPLHARNRAPRYTPSRRCHLSA
jgi:hypothetical protein